MPRNVELAGQAKRARHRTGIKIVPLPLISVRILPEGRIRLLADLSQRGVDLVVFESRHEQDAADRAVLTGLRKASVVSHTMTVTWELASTDAGLWAADCLAGAVSWWLDGDGLYFKALEPLVTILDV